MRPGARGPPTAQPTPSSPTLPDTTRGPRDPRRAARQGWQVSVPLSQASRVTQSPQTSPSSVWTTQPRPNHPDTRAPPWPRGLSCCSSLGPPRALPTRVPAVPTGSGGALPGPSPWWGLAEGSGALHYFPRGCKVGVSCLLRSPSHVGWEHGLPQPSWVLLPGPPGTHYPLECLLRACCPCLPSPRQGWPHLPTF